MATETQQDAAGPAGAVEERSPEDFAHILKESFRPRSKEAEVAVNRAVATLIEEALSDSTLIQDDVLDTIDTMIARIDEKLTAQVNQVIHAPEFQSAESAWRGLHHLVFNSETDSSLRIRVMNISKNELSKTLRGKGAKWDQTPLFKQLYEEEFGTFGGFPFGALIGDYYFSHRPTDVQLLREIGRIASAAHAPFIAGVDPEMLDLDSWTDLPKRRDIGTLFDTPDYAAWRGLREVKDSCYIGLTLPRVLARLPYGAQTEPVEEFAFEEETDGHSGQKYSWMNASYAMAVNINRAFKEYGWTTRIRGPNSGGEVLNLPTHTFPTDDGDVDMKCPTEIAITDRREAELSKAGFMPILHRKNTDKAAFIGAQSVYKPQKRDTEEATASEHLASRLPYMFAVSRFAHYLKCMVRDQIGSTKEEAQLQQWLQGWINRYVDFDPANSSEEVKARKPLSAAQVTVMPDEENPGYYSARFYLRPHFQLEGMDVGLSLVSKLPAQAGG